MLKCDEIQRNGVHRNQLNPRAANQAGLKTAEQSINQSKVCALAYRIPSEYR